MQVYEMEIADAILIGAAQSRQVFGYRPNNHGVTVI